MTLRAVDIPNHETVDNDDVDAAMMYAALSQVIDLGHKRHWDNTRAVCLGDRGHCCHVCSAVMLARAARDEVRPTGAPDDPVLAREQALEGIGQ